MLCQLCQKEFKNLSKHLKNSHAVDPKLYYDQYLKKLGEEFCQNSKCINDERNEPKKTRFISMNVGYGKYCCSQCSNENNPMHNPEIAKRLSDNLKKKFQDKDWKKSVLEKQKKTKKDLYQDENYNNREKAKETTLIRFDKPFYSQTEECQLRIKQRSLIERGVDHHLKDPKTIEKRIITTRFNYGQDYTTQVDEIIKKSQLTKDQHREEINKNIGYALSNIYHDRGYEINEKRRITTLENLGVEYPTQSDIVVKKVRETAIKSFREKVKNNLASLNIQLVDENSLTLCTDKIKLKCLIHNIEYINSWYNISLGYGKCPKCQFANGYKLENEILEFINLELGLFAYKSKSEIKNPKTGRFLELDIFIPEKKFAIELNGLYWHSEEFRGDDYHIIKTQLCQEQGITLLQIFEDEWCSKSNIIKNILKHKLHISTVPRIHARQCKIEEIDPTTKNQFLNQFHIQGEDKSLIKLGAFYKDQLIAVMTFGHGSLSRVILKEFDWELSRFCTDYNYRIPGISSKLLTYFKKNYPWNTIISYADKRWSEGNMYEKLGFEKLYETLPDYWYVDHFNLKRFHRFQLRKRPEEPKDIPEWILRLKEGYKRIWDCGKMKFIMKK